MAPSNSGRDVPGAHPLFAMRGRERAGRGTFGTYEVDPFQVRYRWGEMPAGAQ